MIDELIEYLKDYLKFIEDIQISSKEQVWYDGVKTGVKLVYNELKEYVERSKTR